MQSSSISGIGSTGGALLPPQEEERELLLALLRKGDNHDCLDLGIALLTELPAAERAPFVEKVAKCTERLNRWSREDVLKVIAATAKEERLDVLQCAVEWTEAEGHMATGPYELLAVAFMPRALRRSSVARNFFTFLHNMGVRYEWMVLRAVGSVPRELRTEALMERLLMQFRDLEWTSCEEIEERVPPLMRELAGVEVSFACRPLEGLIAQLTPSLIP